MGQTAGSGNTEVFRMAEVRLTRRELLQGAVASAGLAVASPLRAGSAPETARKFRVALPQEILPLPEGVSKYRTAPGFKWRGIKGWGWTAAQYLEEIPVMADYKMNFLMNCYTSMWETGDRWIWRERKNVNHWYEPLPEEKKLAYERVVQACRRQGIEFCFSMNPILFSDRPFDYDDSQAFQALWRHYAWMQGLGARWFNVSLDDIVQGIDAAGQAKLVNEVMLRLRAKDPAAQMIFCPTWYAGPDGGASESSPRMGTGDTPGVRYTKELADRLNREVYLFWTGPEVCSLTITKEAAQTYKTLARRRLFIWDNYPVNDQQPTLHLGPVMGRDPRLMHVADGFISNPLSPENQANRIPMLTIADYTWNPEAYDPARSIGQSIAHLGRTPEERLALKDLVELYPGRLVDGSLSSGWNSFRNQFRLTLDSGSREAAKDFIAQAEGVSQRMMKLYPEQFVEARKILDADIDEIRTEYSRKYSSK